LVYIDITPYKIKYGVTLELMLLGLTLLHFSFLLYLGNYSILSAITFSIGIVVFLSFKGLLVKENSIKKYFSFFGVKIGKWISISNYKYLILSNINISGALNSRSRSIPTRTKSFTIAMQGENLKRIELYESTNYKECQSKLKLINSILKIKSIDKIEIIKSRNSNK